MNPPQYIQDEDENLSNRQLQKKNMLRSTALSPVACMMLCGAIHIFWGIYTLPIYTLPYKNTYSHLIYSFFIGSMIGAIIGAIFAKKFQKLYFYYTGGALHLIGGILFVALPLNIDAIAAARYLGGIAHGLIFVIGVIHAGEISTNRLRGEFTTGINVCITGGLIASSFIYRIELDKISNLQINLIYGICLIIFDLAALVLIPFFVKESPVFLLDKGEDDEAFALILRLQKQTAETPGVRKQFTELKNMVSEERNDSNLIFVDGNWMPLIQAILLRGLLALGTSMPINVGSFSAFGLSINESIAIIIPLFIRFIGEGITSYLIDRIGRRKILLISTIGAGIFALTWAILLVTMHPTTLNELMNMMKIITVIVSFYQFFLGMGVSAVSMPFLAEAFPLSKKAYSILFVVLAENLIHLIVVVTWMGSSSITELLFVIGIFLVLADVYFFKFFPETKGLSLREARDKNKQF